MTEATKSTDKPIDKKPFSGHKNYRCKKPCHYLTVQGNASVVANESGTAKRIPSSTIAQRNRSIVIERYKSKLEKVVSTQDYLYSVFVALENLEKDPDLTDKQLKRIQVLKKKLLRQMQDSYTYKCNMQDTACFDVPLNPIHGYRGDTKFHLYKHDNENKRYMRKRNRSTARKRKYAQRELYTRQWEYYEENDDPYFDDAEYEDISHIEECIDYLTLCLNFHLIDESNKQDIIKEINRMQRIIENKHIVMSVLG